MKKLQVFVSSTYTDMIEERQAAVEAILRAGHIPAGMELFASEDRSQWETIRQWIDDSDVFMLILGSRYGSIEPESGKSYIELEYDYAVETHKPLFAALIEKPLVDKKLAAHGADVIERNYGLLLTSLEAKVKTRTSRFYRDINGLKLIVMESLSNFSRRADLAGWIRGTEVIDPKPLLDRIARLQSENDELRQHSQQLRVALQEMAHGSSSNELSDDAKKLLVYAKNGDGLLQFTAYSEGTQLSAGTYSVTSRNEREIAVWRAALAELRNDDLIEDVGYQDEDFRLTRRGYEVADELEAAAPEGFFSILDFPSPDSDPA